MLNTIKRFFNTHLAPGSPEARRDPQHAVRLAVAALLIEVTELDYKQSPEEKSVLLDAVRDHFELDVEEASALISLAERELAESTDYFQFTTLINKTYSQEQKIRVIEDLWRVAFSDQELHKYEEHIIRRLAELIHVPHKHFIAAKHRVLDSTSGPG